MEFIRMWLNKKLCFFKSRILGHAELELPPLSKWSSESPFHTWNMYSKSFLASSILLFVAFLLLTCHRKPVTPAQQLVRRRATPRMQRSPVSSGQLIHAWLEGFALFLVLCMMLTVPWEWVRLYQIEVAKKMAILSEGFPDNCNSENLSFWDSFKVWLSWNFAWESDSCENYHRALIVDPFWEVIPLMTAHRFYTGMGTIVKTPKLENASLEIVEWHLNRIGLPPL